MSFQSDLFTKNHSQWVNAYNGPKSHLEFLELRAACTPPSSELLYKVFADDDFGLQSLSGKVVTRIYAEVCGTGNVVITINPVAGDAFDVRIGSTAALSAGTVLDINGIQLDLDSVTTTAYDGTPLLFMYVLGYTPATD